MSLLDQIKNLETMQIEPEERDANKIAFIDAEARNDLRREILAELEELVHETAQSVDNLSEMSTKTEQLMEDK